MGSADFEEIAVAIDDLRHETKATPGCVANALRRYACGLNWPPTFYVEPSYKAVLRRLLDLMGLRTREKPELVTMGVALLELVSSENAELRLSWDDAFTGAPGGGGVYPPSAPDAATFGVDYKRRERALKERWAAHWLASQGKDAGPEAVQALVRVGYAQAIAARVRAFAVKRPAGHAPADEGEPVFAEHRHWATRPSFRLASLDALAWREAWHFNSVTPKHDQRPGEFTWTPLDEATTIRYCESAIIKARYVYASGRDERAVFVKLGTLDVFLVDELVQLAKRESDDVATRALHVLKLGLAATPRGVLHAERLAPEPDVVALLRGALRQGPDELRDAAVTAANFLKWEALLPELEKLEGDRPARAVKEIRRFVAALK